MDQYKVTFTISGTGITYVFKINIDTPMSNPSFNGATDVHADRARVESAIMEKLARQTGVSNGIEIQKIEKLAS